MNSSAVYVLVRATASPGVLYQLTDAAYCANKVGVAIS